jgi:hypothetical protein
VLLEPEDLAKKADRRARIPVAHGRNSRAAGLDAAGAIPDRPADEAQEFLLLRAMAAGQEGADLDLRLSAARREVGLVPNNSSSIGVAG